MKVYFFLACLIGVGSVSSHAQVHFAFPKPKELVHNVEFWKRVYSEWTTEQIAFHDVEDLSIIYHVIKVPLPLNENLKTQRENLTKQAKEEIRLALGELEAARPHVEQEVSGLAKEIFVSLKKVERADKYRRVDFIRGQTGQRDKFAQGYYHSGAHIDEMKVRFEAAGLPKELVAIVFVESMFQPRARSKAGAAGLWQFLRGTAKEFMCVNELVDERFDPILATEAAIAYLKSARQKMVHWPLIITSYNYGRAGILRAMTAVGSEEFSEILQQYEHDRFGFASRNYYAEFLAALEVLNEAKAIFPEVEPAAAWDYELVELSKPALLSLDDKASSKQHSQTVRELNPALTKDALSGKEVLPQGFRLRVPKTAKKDFEKNIVSKSVVDPNEAKSRIRARHKADGRQTLEQIARIYDVFKEQLAERFGYAPTQKVKKGTVVLIRSLDSRYSPLPKPILEKAPLTAS